MRIRNGMQDASDLALLDRSRAGALPARIASQLAPKFSALCRTELARISCIAITGQSFIVRFGQVACYHLLAYRAAQLFFALLPTLWVVFLRWIGLAPRIGRHYHWE